MLTSVSFVVVGVTRLLRCSAAARVDPRLSSVWPPELITRRRDTEEDGLQELK